MSRHATRRDLLIALGATPALLLANRAGAQAGNWQAGDDYTVLSNPQPTDSPGKIEVADFFWYGCPHCYAFLPELDAWRKSLPPDVAYKHVPVAFDGPREAHSKIFFALQALGKAEEMHLKVFDALNQKHMRLMDPNDIADFMAANGIPRDKWQAAYDSFSVANALARSKLMVRAYQIDGTPTLAIDGRFLTSPSIVHTHNNAGALAVADYLIDQVRRERAHKK